MGLLQDLLKEVPLSSVLKERVALAEEKYQDASREVGKLRARVVELENEIENLRASSSSEHTSEFSNETIEVLVALFRAAEPEDRDPSRLAELVRMDRGVVLYHLDRLSENNLAEVAGFNTISGDVHWALTSLGRKLVVEKHLN